ncbi:MAG: sodium ion-translocating decarboxylase subunit beta [Desulfarculus sp.]|nr:sodium ion-translocating decarboxylase subunit beta [Desulfarculus sp.]
MDLQEVLDLLNGIFFSTGITHLSWKYLVMWGISGLFLYLAINKNFEPLLLLPIGFGIFMVNFPLVPLMGMTPEGHGELIRIFYHYGLEWEVIPCVIFLGLGAMTDFGPMIANPKTMLIGAGAQLGVFVTFIGAMLAGFNIKEAMSISIIGGADGPTTIYLTQHLAPQLLGANALAAYSYMAMVPLIQPPIMRLLTSDAERKIRMKQLRHVSRAEKVLYPLLCTAVIAILVPAVTPLMGMFMLGNLMKESGVVGRLSETAQNSLMNIVTIFLGVSVKPLFIFGLGCLAFVVCTAGGIWTAQIMNLFLKEKINPLIGSAGVSAVPMAARVSQVVGQQYDKKNYLLMHAMGPNLAGVIGTAAAAGMFLAMFQ